VNVFSFLSFFFLSFLRKSCLNFKKKLCPPICNLIDYGLLYFNYCLFGFWTFLNFGFFFNFILGYFIQFALLFLFSYSESGLVTLTWVGSSFFRHFFLLNSCFLLAHPFDFFLIPILYRGLLVRQVTLIWLGFFFLQRYIYIYIYIIFNIKLLGLELYNFFLFFFLRVLSVSYFGSYF
jgi:hypothetical protein